MMTMNGSLPQRPRAIAGCSLLAVALPGFIRPASAQTIGGNWEVEFHAGRIGSNERHGDRSG